MLRPLKGEWCAQGRPPTPHLEQQQQQVSPSWTQDQPQQQRHSKTQKGRASGAKEVSALPANGGSDTNPRAPRRSSSRAVGARRPSAGLNDSTRSSSDHSNSTESVDYFEAHTHRESWRNIDQRQRCRESAEPPARQQRSRHMRRAKDLLLQCPPAGTPATPALAQNKDDEGGAAVQITPALVAQDIQGREERHPRSGGDVLPSHRPLYCTRGEAFLEHPRHACPSDGDSSNGTSGRRGFRSPVKLQRTSPERSTHASRTIAASRREGPSFRSAGIVAYSSSSSSSTRSASSSGSCGGAGDGGHTRRTARLASPQPLLDARKVCKMSPNARLARVRDAACAQQQLIDPEAVTAAPTATAMRSTPPSFLSSAKRRWSSSGVHRESVPADADPSDNGGDGIHGGCASHHSSRRARHAARLPPREAESEVPAEVMGASAAETLFIRRGKRGSDSSESEKDSARSHRAVQRNVKSARQHRRHHRQDYAPAHVVLENATPRRADDGAYSYARSVSDSMLPSAVEAGSSSCGRWPLNARSARSLGSMASSNVALAGCELQRQYGAALSSRAMQAAWTSYLQRSGHVSSPEGNARQRATPVQDAPPPITHAHDALPAQRRPNMTAVPALLAHSIGMEPAADAPALEKEVLLLQCSLPMTYTLLAATAVDGHDGGCVGAMAERPWQRVARCVARRCAGWTTEAAQRAHGRAGAQTSDADEKSRGHRRRHRRFTAPHLRGPTPWPAAVQAAAEELLFDGDAATAPQTLPPPQLLLRRESPPHDVVGLPSVWYPPHRSNDNDGPLSGMLWVWFSGDDGGHSEDGVAGVSLSSPDEDVKGSGDSGPKRRSLSEDSTARRRPQTLAPSFRGAWRRCFVVADDSGVRVYPTERDYADFASESLLMAVPYASLAYLVPDFAAAAAAAVEVDEVSAEQEETGWSGSSHSRPSNLPGRGGSPLQRHGSLEVVHVATIAAVTAELVTDATYTYFGFLHCQQDGVTRRAAGMTEAFPTAPHSVFDQEQEDARPFGFAPWRVSGDSGKRYAHQPLAPLLLRTQSRAAHAEWVHFFAAKFNRHLYGLLLPTSSAATAPKPSLTFRPRGNAEAEAVAEAGAADVLRGHLRKGKHGPRSRTRSLSASSTQRQQQHVYDGAASPSALSHHRSHRLPHADEAVEGKDGDEAQDKVDTGACALHRLSNSSSSSIQVGDSCDYGTLAAATGERAAAEARREVRGASLKNTTEEREPFSSRPSTAATPRRDRPSGACKPWWETIAALRYSLAQRDQRLQDQERKMADMAEALRQHAQREHRLEENQDSLRTALSDARDRLANVNAAEGGQQWEGRAALSSKDHIHLRHLPPSVSTPRKRHVISPGACDQSRSPHAPGPTRPDPQHQEQQCGLESLQAQLEELQRRYTEDAVSWRSERAALESRCLASEEKLKHLRSGTSRPSRSLAHQVVHAMDNDDHEIRRGREACVDAVSSGQMLSSALAAAEKNASAAVHADRSASERSRSGGAAPPVTVVSAPDNAFASLLLTFEPSRGRAGAHAGACVDGALIADEASARLLFSGPTANQRGRRWELRHRDTDALLRIQLELLSRAPGDARATTGSTSRRRSQAASTSSAPTAKTRASSSSAHSRAGHTTPRRPTGAAAGALLPSPLSPPPAWSIHAYDQRNSHHYSPLPVSAAAASCSTASTQQRAHMSSLLQTVNMMPRHTRASLLRQATVEQKIQCLTADGKVQIDVTNTSGRTQYPPSQDPPNSLQPSSSKVHRARGIHDRDEPCSLIVSLRSSHPQFFYYRGPQHKQLFFSTSVASHLYAPPPGSASSAGGVDSCGNNSNHQRSPSSLWGPRVVDPVIEDVSRQAWKDLGFPPVAAPAAGTVKSSAAAPEAASSAAGKSNNGGGGDDRPLLVREELADCVLLPGERRTFLLEVDTPSVLQRLMAPLVQQKARITSVPALRGNAVTQDSCPLPALRGSPRLLGDHSRNTGNKPQPRTAHTHGSEDGTNIPLSENTPRATEVFHLSRRESSSMGGEPNPTLFPAASRTVAKDAKSVLGAGQQQQRAVSKRGSGPLQSSRSTSSSSSSEISDCNSHSCNSVAQLNKTHHPTRQWTMPWGADDEGDRNGDAADQTPPGNGRRNRRPHEKRDMSDTEDGDERSLSPQPLSIVQDSMTTRESLDASRLSAATAPGAPRPGPSGGTAHDCRLTSRDFTVPSSISTTAASTPFLAKANREDSGKSNTHPHVAAAGSGATRTLDDSDANEAANPANGSEDRAQRWLPPASTSQRPTFYVYYAPLGDENKCVDEARKWLLKEQHAYRQWLDKLVRVIVDLERKREQGWIRTSNNSVQSPHRPLGARRVLPPMLGELVRWRSGDGGSGAVIDVMAPSPITAAAFQYYYGNLPLQKIVPRPLSQLSVRGSSTRHSWMSGGSGSNSNAGGGYDKEVVLVLPPSFAATRHNRVSAKARKMFKEERHGAGTVVLPLRVKPQPAPQPSPSSSQTSEEVCDLSRKSSEPPYSRVWMTMSSPWQLRSYQATSPPHYTMENSSELGDYRGSSTPMSESTRTEKGYERSRFKSGCGLALLEDSAATLPTFSRNSLADGMPALPSKTDNTATPMDLKGSFLSPSSSKVNRTETLDPVAAEMAAAGPPTSRWSSLSGIYGQMHRGFSDSPLQQRPRLPSSPSIRDMTSPDSRIPSSSSTGVGGTGAASQDAARLSYNSPPPSSGAPGNARSADDSAAASSAATAVGRSGSTPTTTTSSNGVLRKFSLADIQGAITDGALTATAPAGSFAAQLLQSICGYGGSAKPDVDEEGNATPRMRDISSAPPQTLAYRRRSTAVSNSNSFTGSMFGSSFSMRPQERLSRMADQSMAAGSQVKVAVQQLTATASDLVQQHGPPAISGLMSLLNFLKDTVFTPENVGMIQMVVTPMVMAFSVLVVAYLLLSGEGSGSDVFSLIDGRGL